MARRNYPDTPSGHARALRDREADVMSRKGHVLNWRRGHGQRWLRGCPGFTGACERCGDLVRVASTGSNTMYLAYEDAWGKPHGPRRCSRRRLR